MVPDPLDFLDTAGLLSDSERLVGKTVREFVTDNVLPEVGGWWEAGEFPTHLIPEMARMGMFGMNLEGYGCAGLGPVEYGVAALELEAGDSGLRSFVSVQGSLCMFPIWKYGSSEQKAKWLPRMARGEVVGCFGLTEADAGSDPSSMRTTARRVGSDWVIDGSKSWITNGGIADLAVIWAKTPEGVRGFLVPTDAPGFSAHPIDRKASMRASVTSTLVLEGVRLPEEMMLPGVSTMRGPLSCLTEARLGIVFGAMGAARACYEAALGYASERSQFGVPIASFQLTQSKLVEMMVAVQRGTLLAIRIGRLREEGKLTPEQVSVGKYNNVGDALAVARTARSILGANGITFDYPVMRHVANLETVYTYEGTHEIHTLILGNALTGIPAFQAPGPRTRSHR
ncbi:MAG: acyl-CoA dehydrogenase [Acidimicrobiia bacterium]|nr:acyl-CoA dehydrogenase [Acidimicrobiia bacterium]